MKQIRSFRFPAHLSKRQQKHLDEMLEAERLVQNDLIELQRARYKNGEKHLSFYDLCKHIKNNKLLGCTIVRGIALRVTRSYQNFFRRCKDPTVKKKGPPKFKKVGQVRSLTILQSLPKIREREVFVTKLGLVKFKPTRPLEGKVKAISLKKEKTGKIFVTFVCETERQIPQAEPKYLGLDLGLNNFVATSDGQFFTAPKPLKADERRIVRLHRELSRKQPRSKNRDKARICLARAYEKHKSVRDDFAWKLCKTLLSQANTFVIENLNVQGMLQNHRLAKSISDVSWSDFARKLAYKAENAGGGVIEVDPKNTSQLCSACGKICPKKLAQRTHACWNCGLTLDRDTNAAINILARGIPGAIGESIQTPDRESVRPVHKHGQFSLTQEARISGD